MAMNFLGIKFVGGKWIIWGFVVLLAFVTFILLYAVLELAVPEKPYGPMFGYIAIPTFIGAFFVFWKVYDVEINSLSEQQRQTWVFESRRDYRLLPSERRRLVKHGIVNGIFVYVMAILLLMVVVIVFLSVSQENLSQELDGISLATVAWPVLVTAFFAPQLIWKWARNLESLHFTREDRHQDSPE